MNKIKDPYFDENLKVSVDGTTITYNGETGKITSIGGTGGGGSTLLAGQYDPTATDGMLLCSQYNPLEE